MTRDAVIERVRKMRAHAASADAIGNPAEAEAYLAKARAMMARHAIADDDLGDADDDALAATAAHTQAPGYRLRQSRAAWEFALAYAVSLAYACTPLMGHGSNACWMYGYRPDRDLAAEAFARLHNYAERESRRAQAARREALRREAGHGNTGTYRESWLLAFAYALERAVSRPLAGAGMAVALQSRRQRTTNAARAQYPASAGITGPVHDIDVAGWRAGTAAAEAVSVRSDTPPHSTRT